MPVKNTLPFYLASQSPRRRELLENLRLNFNIYVPKSPELPAPKTHGRKETPLYIVKTIAAAKAKAAHRELTAAGKQKGIILSADTLVFVGREVLGKPKDKKDAKRMLQKLSGKTHMVATAVHILLFENGKVREKNIVVKTKVKFFPISAKDMKWYLATGESLDKAGAYGAQSFGGVFLEKFTGSYTNVVGLPVGETLRLFSKVTNQAWQDWCKP